MLSTYCVLGSWKGREPSQQSRIPWKAPLVTEVKLTEADLGVAEPSAPQERAVPPLSFQDPQVGVEGTREWAEQGQGHEAVPKYTAPRRNCSQPSLTRQETDAHRPSL